MALESFAGARDLYEITIPEMQILEAAMMATPGVLGARQAGAGFGGCMVAFVEAEIFPAFATDVEQAYAAATGVLPKIYAVAPAAGAGKIDKETGDGERRAETSGRLGAGTGPERSYGL
ncbi:MAG: hypothetical protein IPK16_30160 [Anaerolineales bacterium]|nr:hypothetical protein [Anaerolineales bacterium]